MFTLCGEKNKKNSKGVFEGEQEREGKMCLYRGDDEISFPQEIELMAIL